MTLRKQKASHEPSQGHQPVWQGGLFHAYIPGAPVGKGRPNVARQTVHREMMPHCVGGGRRPDLDDVVKATLDALQSAKVIFDDRQVVEIWSSSYYAGQVPLRPNEGVYVVVSPL